MSTLGEWFKRIFSKQKQDGDISQVLREFVYLDEVSVISLLSSQSGELKSEISSTMSLVEDAQVSGRVAASAGVLKAQHDSKYQSTSSEATQTTRKSNVQSLFRDLLLATSKDLTLSLRELSVAEHRMTVDEVIADKSLCASEDDLIRGRLVEATVELEADNVYKLCAFMSEFYDIALQHPEILGPSSLPLEMAQVTKVLERLLAGLVPVRGTATDLMVFEHSGKKFVARKSTVDRLGLSASTVTVVGVTGKSSYWKDLRRVLFSRSRFTVLCRISRDGIQNDWTPVKLSDVFSTVVPQMASLSDTINAMSQALLTGASSSPSADEPLRRALAHYASQILDSDADIALDSSKERRLNELITDLSRQNRQDVAYQRQAFDAVSSYLGASIAPQDAIELRREARLASGLGLFNEQKSFLGGLGAHSPESVDENLLDVEFVAMYW